jgi:hypothetical protein
MHCGQHAAASDARASEVAMKECRSTKVRKIVALRARAAKLAADYDGAQAWWVYV